MSRRNTVGCFALWLLSQFCVVLGGEVSTAEYFPLIEGSTWTYRDTRAGITSISTLKVLPGTTKINGVATRAKQGSSGITHYYTSDVNGIWWHRAYDPVYPQLTWTMIPPIVTTNGTMDIPETIHSTGIVDVILQDYGSGTLSYSITATLKAMETVTVPAGTYEAIRLERTVRVFGDMDGYYYDESSISTHWYTKHLGTVKSKTVDSNGTKKSVLISADIQPPVETVPFLPFLPLLLE